METPPPPSYTSKKKPQPDRTSKTPFQTAVSNVQLRDFRNEFQADRAAKTPFQAAVSSVQLRDFRSEYQPRVSSRFAQDRANKSNHEPQNSLLARLGSMVKQVKQQVPSSSMSVAATSSSNAAPATTPGPSFPPTIASYSRPNLTKPEEPNIVFQLKPNDVQRHRITPKTPLDQPVAQPLKAHLIQDTKIAPSNRIGPIATATKAPLSVSQYTQPTPSSNKYAHQVSRAHSEPSIKYQVKVNDKTYKVLKKIGSGGSAKVYEGFEPNTYQSVAIKIINIAQADPRSKDSYFNEISILSQLKNSKHVVRLYNSEYKRECNELVIVMEKGEVDLARVLDDHFKSREKSFMIDGIFIKSNWRGMLLAVEEIHRHGIVHADLKPVNFILVKGQLKLIDFGIASSLEPGGTSIVKDYQIGTINYMAPEALRNRALDASFIAHKSNAHDQPDFCYDENNEKHQPSSKKTLIKYNSKADIWSLGCILYNIVYGRPPFDRYSDILSKLHAITDPKHVIDIPAINNAHLMDCMKLCLRYNPSDRPLARELLDHDYLKNDIVILGEKQRQ